jgi:hypothetical protein
MTGTDRQAGAAAVMDLDVTHILVRGVPRILVNSLAPLTAFVIGRQVAGVVGAIVAAAAVSLTLFGWERRKGRPGVLAWISLVVLSCGVVLGLVAHSATLYFLPAIAMDIAEGLACFVSCLTRMPLGRVLAGELVTLPARVFALPEVRRPIVWVTLVWGAYFTARGLLCGWFVVFVGTNAYLVARAIVDAPVVLPLIAVSALFTLRRLRTALGPAVPSVPERNPV